MARYEIISHCTFMQSDQETPCDAICHANGVITGGCGDPCSFIMKKAGAGNPPFLHETDLVKEMEKLMMRRSRNGLRRE